METNATLTEISEHEYIRIRKPMTNNKNIRNSISTYLREHAAENSEVIQATKYDRPPFVFDQDSNKRWYLVNDWEEECDKDHKWRRHVELAKKWKAGPKRELPDERFEGEQDHEPKKHDQRFEFVTFHQAYSYEDFVEGIRPKSDKDGNVKYGVVPGVFKRICQKAKVDPKQQYAIFIDEINRGNIASIFGELITLLETDKRVTYGEDGSPKSGMMLTLPYSGEKFGVPANLDVYGTMNTADRSIALLDTALRRRFQFEELMPDSGVIEGSSDGRIKDDKGGEIDLRKLLEAINSRIRFLLSRDMTIGHSYLIRVRNFDQLKDVLLSRIIPLLQEYFYDDWHKIQLVFRDVKTGREKPEPHETQIIKHEIVEGKKVFGFENDFEDSTEYRVATKDEITPDAIRKVYEEKNNT
ncbi:MAG: AAA family ATPase [Candidatus Dadabacteria bacterium]|nr:AAA family ATPase [Candidatus Dadabacteria bacterium]